MTSTTLTAPDETPPGRSPKPKPRAWGGPNSPQGRTVRALLAVNRHAVLIALSLMFALPFVFMLLQSVMPIDQSQTDALLPSHFAWSNYTRVLDKVPLVRYFFNTAMVCILSTTGTIISCVPVAYALSRMHWRGRNAVFIVLLATMMLPYQVLFVPQYEIFSKLGWINTIFPLTVPSLFADAFSVFLLRQFFLTLPGEVIDAARVDGAGEFRILTRVVMPMAKPGIMAVAIFQFLFSWSDFFGPNIYLQDQNSRTLAVGLASLNTELAKTGETNLVMAAAVMFVAPVIVLFFFAQKVFIEGVTLTGVKG